MIINVKHKIISATTPHTNHLIRNSFAFMIITIFSALVLNELFMLATDSKFPHKGISTRNSTFFSTTFMTEDFLKNEFDQFDQLLKPYITMFKGILASDLPELTTSETPSIAELGTYLSRDCGLKCKLPYWPRALMPLYTFKKRIGQGFKHKDPANLFQALFRELGSITISDNGYTTFYIDNKEVSFPEQWVSGDLSKINHQAPDEQHSTPSVFVQKIQFSILSLLNYIFKHGY